jgi:hypothetical protein
MLMAVRNTYLVADLSPAAPIVATGNGTEKRMEAPFAGVVVNLYVSAAAAGVGAALDVFVQTLIHGTWVDVVHFTQVLGNGGAKNFVAKIAAPDAQALFELATALAAGSVRNLVGDAWRARWVVAGAGPSFTFTVGATPA